MRSAPHPPPHFPRQRVCREASAGVVDELQHSIEVMRPEDRQSVILCIAEVVNCDVPDQPSAYSADRSADGSLRSGLWWRSSSETGGGEVAEGVALVRIGDVLPNDGGELLEIDAFFEEILYGIPIPVEKIGIEFERLVNALVLEDLGCSCDLRGELRLRLSRRRYVSHDGPCRGAMGGLEPPDAPFLVARTLSNPQHRCDHWSSTR